MSSPRRHAGREGALDRGWSLPGPLDHPAVGVVGGERRGVADEHERTLGAGECDVHAAVILEDWAVEAPGRDERHDDDLLAGALEPVDGVDGDVVGNARPDGGHLCPVGRDDTHVPGGNPGVEIRGHNRRHLVGLPGVGVAVRVTVGVDKRDTVLQVRGEQVGRDSRQVTNRAGCDLAGCRAQLAVVELSGGKRLDVLGHSVLALQQRRHTGVLLV